MVEESALCILNGHISGTSFEDGSGIGSGCAYADALDDGQGGISTSIVDKMTIIEGNISAESRGLVLGLALD
jgi:hypothetical protein